ncbi:MAG: pyridoxamine 5'-phosphate oxidase family protein [Acidobacteria bacterium]|nr:pyridoxamine 5'-phosphate oxidase family protein [Acidobacteriota bacterium]
MRTMFAAAWLLFTVGLPDTLPAQATQADPPPRAQVISAAAGIMQAAHFATLITIGEDGQPQARIVDPFIPEADLTIWIATKPITRKASQIRRDPRVTLLYFDTTVFEYVTVFGKAELVADSAEKARLWKDQWGGLYKDKNHGSDYALIRVRPWRLEVVSPSHGLRGDSTTWRPVILDLP